MWPRTDLAELLGIEHPIVQAPMAGSTTPALAAAVSNAGGLGSLGCASFAPDTLRAETEALRKATNRAFNLNFFVHEEAVTTAAETRRMLDRLAPYYAELGAEAPDEAHMLFKPFDDAMLAAVLDLRPRIASFHFGLPDAAAMAALKEAGIVVLSSATTVAEARALEVGGADAIVAQGGEAGGHRGTFLGGIDGGTVGTFALVPQVADAVSVPVIAAGGIADGRGIAAAFALGAAGAQIGTAYLFTPESLVSDLHRAALVEARDDQTALTNLFSGRPARGLMNRLMREAGPMSDAAPAFPTAGGALAPIKAKAEAKGSTDFTSLWSGQAAALGVETGAGDLTRRLAEDALRRLASLAP